jgi:hypothetical protein
MRLPRITVRRIMVAVAVVALVVSGMTLASRHFFYRNQALKHEVLAALFRDGHAHFGPNPKRMAYHIMMQSKYEDAARYPWLAIDPRPPTHEFAVAVC